MSNEQPDTTRKIDTIKWEAPPIRAQYDWLSIATRLRSSPMTWALVFEQGYASVVNAIRQGSIGDVHPDLGFETKTTRNKREAPRRCDLYMRFNPDREKDLRAAIRATREKA